MANKIAEEMIGGAGRERQYIEGEIRRESRENKEMGMSGPSYPATHTATR